MTEYKPSELAVKSKELMGKEVMSSEGKKVGEVNDIYIHPDEFKVEGIEVHMGMFKDDLYLDKKYIERLERQAVVLNIIPVDMLKDRKIVDPDGKKIGKVKDLKHEGAGKVISFVVERKGKKDMMVTSTNVDRIGKDIVLTRKASAQMKA